MHTDTKLSFTALYQTEKKTKNNHISQSLPLNPLLRMTSIAKAMCASWFRLNWVSSFYLAIGRGFGAGAGWSLSLHLRSRLRDTDPHKVDHVVQIGEEVCAREPAVMAVLLNARFLEPLEPVWEGASQV